MAFSHAYLIELSQCWRGQPEKLAERRALWPDVLTWAWFLDPARVEPYGRKEALEILSTATLHAHRTHAPLWDKPIAIYRDFQQNGSYKLWPRLADELDRHDVATCAVAGVELVEPLERTKRVRPLTMRERRAAMAAARREKQSAAGGSEEPEQSPPPAIAELEAAEQEAEHVAAELGAADTDQAEPPKG